MPDIDPVHSEPVQQDVLPDGILYVSATDGLDSLDDTACDYLHEMWAEYGDDVGRKKDDLNSYLREKYFKDWVKDTYDKRPIYFPLTSSDKNFVAHVSIHRWDIDTLRKLMANHLKPELKRLEGQLEDMRKTRGAGNVSSDLEDRIVQHRDWVDELTDFIAMVRQCAEEGPPKWKDDEPDREQDHRYDPVLDDGVMINSAALWPLLEPVWKKPRDWWNSLATEKGYYRKHFDWSQLAAKYWPTRVAEKCGEDPSLAIAQNCFWKYHPKKGYEWELRLKFDFDDAYFVLGEEHPDWTISEERPARTSAESRKAFLTDPENREAIQSIRNDERSRREREAEKDNRTPNRMIPVPEAEAHLVAVGKQQESEADVVDLDGEPVEEVETGFMANIRYYSRENNISLAELAERASVPEEKLRGPGADVSKLTVDQRYDLAEALGVKLKALTAGSRSVDENFDPDAPMKEAARDEYEDR